jgi:dihydrofolate reductase
MRRLTSIVAVNRQEVIGAGNALPWRLKSDLAFFKAQTTNNVVIMGRKTFDSIGQRPLPGRFNIIVSHEFRMFPSSDTCVGATGIGEALAASENAPRAFKEVFIIGGQSMYEQFAPLVDRYLITVVDKIVENGDTFFRDSLIGNPLAWQRAEMMLGDANDKGDEVNFDIFELIREKNAEQRETRRGLMGRAIKHKPRTIPRRSEFGTTLNAQPIFAI